MSESFPLNGVLVVEIGVFIAAPFATTQLADLGARVIKVETPGVGDPVRSSGPFIDDESSNFVRMNRNKESVELDLKTEQGRNSLLALLEKADVLVENLRPGALKKMGLDYASLKDRFPGLIYASASGWGQDGPLSPLPGLDIMAQARSGLMSITGYPDMPPAKVGVPICDITAALYLTIGIVTALFERTKSGDGQFIDVSLFESAVSLSVWEQGRYFVTEEIPRPSGSAHQSIAPYQAVKASDGYVTIGPSTESTWRRFCNAFQMEGLLSNPSFASPRLRFDHRDSLVREIEKVFSDFTVDEIVNILNEAGVPVAPISDYSQVFTDEHLAAREFFWTGETESGHRVTIPGNPIRYSRSRTVRSTAGPRLGSHNSTISTEFEDQR